MITRTWMHKRSHSLTLVFWCPGDCSQVQLTLPRTYSVVIALIGRYTVEHWILGKLIKRVPVGHVTRQFRNMHPTTIMSRDRKPHFRSVLFFVYGKLALWDMVVCLFVCWSLSSRQYPRSNKCEHSWRCITYSAASLGDQTRRDGRVGWTSIYFRRMEDSDALVRNLVESNWWL